MNALDVSLSPEEIMEFLNKAGIPARIVREDDGGHWLQVPPERHAEALEIIKAMHAIKFNEVTIH